MPQISPMMWLLLMVAFSFLLMVTCVKIYFLK